MSSSPLFNVEFVKLVRISKYYQLASVIILLYDYVITLDMEIEWVWSRLKRSKITIADALFLLNRYFPLISYFWIIFAYGQSYWSPSAYECFHQIAILDLVTKNPDCECIIGVIVMLRLYAVYLGAVWVPACLGILVLVSLAFGIRASTSVTLVSPHIGVNGCIMTVKDGSESVFAMLWAMGAIFDATVFFMTIWGTRQRQMCNADQKTTGPKCLPGLLLRHGIIYFFVMFSAKVVNFAVFWIVSDAKDLITINWTFNHTITVIMISRLVLNLRAQGEQLSP
ncbi:uncharacterized protein FOMMEDRAFT_162153 [Fomitiporia mediterranea MF3/22]|uniref:uncharacterized protein n=1 Tax=Fomitiporia mediterranea (strain MF3/22) TaxID=694068 RepID=UPI000440785B|nr:uncharacterized protein FOMMEDRAFT_162153 [Fomitiporia mediterranea MF3/22]EJC97819.1 hypothetical protein FOMMEDRAFT_162153 [Fomitiporia mediterranea MF3/22]